MTGSQAVAPTDVKADSVPRLLHQLAQPLAGAALALDIALLAESRRDSEEIRTRLHDAVKAVDQALAILRAWSDERSSPVAFEPR